MQQQGSITKINKLLITVRKATDCLILRLENRTMVLTTTNYTKAITTMKSLLVACLICVGSTTVHAQQHPTQNTHCQVPVADILANQSFDVDDPISENARNILFEMYTALNLIYTINSSDPLLSQYVNDFNEAKNEAHQINMNISMFQDDIDYVDALNL